MEQFHSSDIRNFAIVGHGASGKTSLAEAILMLGGEINRLGTIEDGSTGFGVRLLHQTSRLYYAGS